MGGDREHTITVDDDGDVVVCGSGSGYKDTGISVYRTNDLMNDDVRALLTAPRSRPLPPGAPMDAVPSAWSDDGVICAGSDLPVGWEWRGSRTWEWYSMPLPHPNDIVEARPPQPPATEKVRLDQIVGRVLVGETEKVRSRNVRPIDEGRWEWYAPRQGAWCPLPLDADGMVEVIAP